MNTIKNLARRPLQVPLPHGKKLHLAFGKTAQVSDDALDHPPFKKLVDEGLVEVLGHSTTHPEASSGSGPAHLDSRGPEAGSAAATPRRGNRGD